MTQEDKDLLLIDLCSRLAYGIFVKENRESLEDSPIIYTLCYHPYIDNCKPYLRPMSSMTKEEEEEQYEIITQSFSCSLENSESATTMLHDWLLSKHFDVRGLINKNLALEAPEGMYNIK